jgi:PhoPQ-activated pathogenicity-related protein
MTDMIKRIKAIFWKALLLFLAGYVFIQCSTETDDVVPPGITPGNALSTYLNNSDETYDWEVINSFKVFNVMVYDLLLTSQKWHEYTWKHQLTILIPDDVMYDEALLWITGGSLENDYPKWTDATDEEALAFGMLAINIHAVTAILRQTPNQPLFDGLTEDALISYTLNNYQNDGDYSWPLLFPMVKSAVRAMDAVQEFAEETENLDISGFLVAGASKRGWTTWLTGASDARVKAIVPAVIDILNMPVNLDYQLETWGAYSEQIQDYVDLGIPQAVNSQLGEDLTTMIDPYSYRDRLTMPKMILIGTNDPYWPVDAIKHYIDDLQGENYIHYVPNAGHDLNGGEQAISSVGAFFYNTITDQPYPQCSWELTETGTDIILNVTGSPNKIQAAYLWSANSPDRDFRDDTWSSGILELTDSSAVNITVQYPEAGFRAFYIDLEYTDINQGNYTISTRMFVADEDEVL